MGAQPIVSLGSQEVALPALAIDHTLQSHRWAILCTDFLHFCPNNVDNTDRVLAFAKLVQEEARRAKAARAAQDTAAKALKTPSEVFPLMVPIWRWVAGVAIDAALSQIYQLWGASSKSERWAALQRCLEARTREPDAATLTPLLTSKELYELILHCNLGTHIQQVNNLSAGILPFTCSHFIGEKGVAVQVRAEQYDLALAGLLMPTVAEQETFRTKDVPLPATTYHCGAMVQGMSVALDVIQGVNHPNATALCQFCHSNWQHIMAVLEQSSAFLAEGNILPRICREIQSKVGIYFRWVLARGVVPTPRYGTITEKILRGQFNLMLPMPVDIQLPCTTSAPIPAAEATAMTTTT